VVSFISQDRDYKSLAVCLGLKPAQANSSTQECMEPLAGMDLHPRKNAFQGLACLGSRKSELYQGSVYVGSMLVSSDGSSWEWIKEESTEQPCCCTQPRDDTNDSVASTVVSYPMSTTSMNQRLNIWVECSIILPSASCVGLTIQNTPDMFNFPCEKAAAAKQPSSTHSNSKTLDNNLKHLWGKLLFESKGLEWFRQALGGNDETRRLFAQAYTNIQKISKPRYTPCPTISPK